MANYAIQTPSHAGAQVTLAAPGGTTGDTVQPTPGAALLVVNASASPITVTLPFASGLPKTDGLAVTSRTVTIAAGTTELIPVPPSVYGTALQAVNYSAVASVTVAAIFIPTT